MNVQEKLWAGPHPACICGRLMCGATHPGHAFRRDMGGPTHPNHASRRDMGGATHPSHAFRRDMGRARRYMGGATQATPSRGIWAGPLTKAVSVSGHGGHDAPAPAAGVVALHRVEGLQPVPPPHHVQAVLQHGYSKLQPPPAHHRHLLPRVPAQAVLLDARRPCRDITMFCSAPTNQINT